ncbi:MAG: hypothetical protein EBY32_02930 [Proteobacteria bacterium]|nr:hypothetical protein [Pseudomonadota bacterium]
MATAQAKEGWQNHGQQNHFLEGMGRSLHLAGEGIWDCFGVFRGDIWALTEQGPPKVVRMSRFC